MNATATPPVGKDQIASIQPDFPVFDWTAPAKAIKRDNPLKQREDHPTVHENLSSLLVRGRLPTL
jgi:hypothetical protein